MQKRQAIRYFENAKEILSKSSIENNRYVDDKYVKSPCHAEQYCLCPHSFIYLLSFIYLKLSFFILQ